jgi:hypothetical protein
MATVTISKRSDGVNSFAHGSFTGDGSAVTITLGFVPNHFILFNETDAMKWEKFQPMAAANSIKTVTAGTQTADANSQIVFNSDGTVTIGTTAAPNAKACKFRASL